MSMQFTLPKGATVAPDTADGFWLPTEAKFTDEHGNMYAWTARKHRKGRYPVLLETPYTRDKFVPPRLLPVWFGYPYSDLSYWVGLVFTLGCVAWVINGHYVLYSINAAVAASQEQAEKVAAAAALVGGTLFEIGSWLLYWEALNQEPDIQTGKHLQLKHHNHSHTHSESPPKSNTDSSSRVSVRCSSSRLVAPSAQDMAAGSAGSASQHHVIPVSPARYVIVPVANECPRVLRQRLMQQQGAQLGFQQPLLIQMVSTQHSNGSQASHMLPISAQQQQQQRASVADICPAAAAAPAGPGVSSGGSNDSSAAGKQPVLQQPTPHLVLQPDPQLSPGAKGDQQQQQQQDQPWRWFGLRYRDLGFTCSLLQLIGATIFWVPCIFGAPGVYAAESLDNYTVWNGVYWGLQMAGATFFIISAWGFMVEEQPTWYRPQPTRLGWHVGFWNLIGAIGFFLNGAFGLLDVPQGVLQLGGTAVSTFWGSYAFLIGSYLQLLEAVNKHPDSFQWKRMLLAGKGSS